MVPIDETGQYMDLAQLMQGINAQLMYEYSPEQASYHQPQQPLARQAEDDQRYSFYPPAFPYYPGYYKSFPFYPYPYAPFARPRRLEPLDFTSSGFNSSSCFIIR
ncbi:hypothetical protein ACFFH4_23110 [Halalkalibacter alkalisediminis]|uniref:Uncharacterized protein n=2 Tax=Halalkalibacter alkalisediminis TaxID=935616 RepID=A0ABV6NLX9_9BACI